MNAGFCVDCGMLWTVNQIKNTRQCACGEGDARMRACLPIPLKCGYLKVQPPGVDLGKSGTPFQGLDTNIDIINE